MIYNCNYNLLVFSASLILLKFEEKSEFPESFLEHSVRGKCLQVISKENEKCTQCNLLIVPHIADVANGLNKAQDSTALKK